MTTLTRDISGAKALVRPNLRRMRKSRLEAFASRTSGTRLISQARVGAILATPVLKTPQTADPRLPGKGGKIFYCRPCD